MGGMASQITSLTIVYSTVYSGADQRKHQSSASLAFVRGIHRWPVNSPHKWPVTRKMAPIDDVIMYNNINPIISHSYIHADSLNSYWLYDTYIGQWSVASLVNIKVRIRLKAKVYTNTHEMMCGLPWITILVMPRWRHQMETLKLRVTVHLCGEFTGDRWIPRTKASDAEL